MSLPTDLPREIAERTEQPGFEAVLDRARAGRRRRRTTIASGLAAAVVVGGLTFTLGGPGDRSTDPAPPAPSTAWDGSSQVDPALPGDVRAVLDDDRLDLWTAAGSSGAVAVLWRGCDQEPCQFALVTRDGDQVSGTALGASFPRLSSVPGGWLIEDATGTFRLTPSGERTQIHVTGRGSGDVRAGDTAVDGWRLLRGDTLIPLKPRPDAYGAYITPDGRLVDASVSANDRAASAVAVTGSGDHVAMVHLGDDPDGSIPVLDVQVSHDGGDTWTVARGLGDVRDVSSLVVTPGGTTYVTTGTHGLIRIDADGTAVPSRVSSSDTSVFTLDDAVCLVAEAGRVDQLRCSADDGATWTPLPLPGFS